MNNNSKFIEKQIKSIDELLDFVTEINEKHGLRIWFRGVADKSWDLIPTIQRSKSCMERERFITNDFYIKAHQVMNNPPNKENYSAWMSIMQHYGLPTRMLDWSSSPLIATFFAIRNFEKFPNVDACVWILTPGLLNKKEGFGDCIYPVDAKTAQAMLLPAFKEKVLYNDINDKILACHSVENNLRMYSQQANFTIHNSKRKLIDICDDNMLYKIIIPSEARKKLLMDLEIFGITESFIFPDLDHISHDLKRINNLI